MMLESAAALAGVTPDVLICDPPYAAGVHSRAVSNNPYGNASRVRKRDLGFNHLSPELLNTLLDLCAVTRRWACFFTDIESVGSVWQPSLGKHYVRSVPWVRWSQPQLSGDRPGSGCEMVVCAHPPTRKHWNGPGSLQSFDELCLRGKGKHPTEKPLDLMLSLVSWFSDPGDLVCDPCCGSGTTALACKLLGRHFIGAELQDSWRVRVAERLVAPLSERDNERVHRWLQKQSQRCGSSVIITPAAIARKERALSDVAKVSQAIDI